MSRAETYARDVLSSKVVAGRLIKLAAQRFLSDLERDDIYFDEAEANKFIFFSENHCCLWEDRWEGQPVKILPWMAFIFQQIYGWYRKSDGLRRVRQVYVQVAKKNGKTTIAGTLANFHLFADERINTPKVFVGANNEDQAKICVNITGQIIEKSPDLNEHVTEGTVKIFRYMKDIREIVHSERNGFITPLSKETGDKQSKTAGGKHGINPSLGIIDEYAMAADDALLDTIESAQAARQEPLMFIITTAGFNLSGPCFQKLRRVGVDVLEGTIQDDAFLPFIFEMDRTRNEKGDTVIDSIEDEANWIKCNPSLDVSVSREFLRGRMNKAKQEGGSSAVNVKTLNFDEWCETPEVWIPKDIFDKNIHGMKVEDLAGLRCFGGLHVLSARELNAFSLFFPNVRENLHATITLFWMPETAVVEPQTKMDFGRWTDVGWIKTCPGNTIDNDFAFDLIMGEISKFDMNSFAFPVEADKSDIVQALVKSGIVGNPISQGYKTNSEPTKVWEKLILSAQVEHFSNPVLSWTNSNCMKLQKGDDVRIERSGGKTAGVVACINAVAQWKTIEADNEQMEKFTFESL